MYFRNIRQIVVKLGSKSVVKFLSVADEHFLRDVIDDIKWYLINGCETSVLVFPPLSNHRRFLIHNSVQEDYSDKLGTFSVGLGDDRRTVVCHKNIIICHPGTSKDPSMGYDIDNIDSRRNNLDAACGGGTCGSDHGGERLLYRATVESGKEQTGAERIRASRTKQRRPDRAVYVPRAKRTVEPSVTSQCKEEHETTKEVKNKHHTPVRKSLDRTYCNVYTPPHLRQRLKSSEKTTKNNDSVSSDCDSVLVDATSAATRAKVCDLSDEYEQYNLVSDYVLDADDVQMDLAENINHMDQRIDYIPDKGSDSDILPEEINRSNRRIIRQRYKNDVLIISDPVVDNSDIDVKEEDEVPLEVNEEVIAAKPKLEAKSSLKREENDWEAVFDEDGECLDPTLLEELTSAVGRVKIAKPKNNYEQYQTKGQIMLTGSCDESFGHVVEVYSFPSEFKTNDLLSVFSDYKDSGFEIKWVDDTHALIVFSSSKVAAEVMSSTHPMVKTRPLHEATLESRQKAKKCAQFLQPYKQRPETCAALARRLVTGALGLRPAADTDHDRNIIRMAREKKRQAAMHKEAAWNGSLTSQNCDDS